ncbi:MAG: ABC transporter ATP-binding protein [Dethiobacteria bacterium]
MTTPLLEVKDLQVDFLIRKYRITAVHDISFSVEEKTTLGIVGESGCGKTVTATAIMRLLPKHTSVISNGSIKLYGDDLLKKTEKEMNSIRGNKISMIFQDPLTSLNPVYTIGHQLIEILRVHTNISRKEAFNKGADMLEKVGIPSPLKRMREFPHQLSGGMRQRVMIAMALLCEPALLIADEPTTALDVTIQAQILDIMTKLKEDLNTSILMITHDMGVIAGMADYVMVMYAGEIVEYGTAAAVFDTPLHPYTQGLLNSMPRVDQDVKRLYTIEGLVPSLENMPSGCRFANRCNRCMERCKLERPPLFKVNGSKVRCWAVVDRGG